MLFKKKSLSINTEEQKNNNDDFIPLTRELMSIKFKSTFQNSADIMENEVGSSGITLFYIGQSKNTDSFGLGEVYRSTVRHSKLTDEKWYKMYKNAKVNVNVDFSVLRTGLND